jgi:hypothetical protein
VAHGAHLGGMITGIVWMRWAMTPHRSFEFWQPFSAWRSLKGNPDRPSPKRSSRNTTEDLPPGEFISREVDPILEKISAHGIHSLTERERQILEAARSRMARR